MLTQGRFFKQHSQELYDMLEKRRQGWSYSAIARYYGKHHATIMYHCKKYKVQPNKELSKKVVPINIFRTGYICPIQDTEKYGLTLHRPVNQGKSYEDYKKEDFLRSISNPQARLLYQRK